MRGLLGLLLALNLLALTGNLLREGNAEDGRGAGIVDAPIINGDTNGDGARDLSDAVYLLTWLFAGGPEPIPCTCGAPPHETECNDQLDNDGDGAIDANDPDCPPLVDEDGDGFGPEVDCDDTNVDIHPGAQEDCANGIDDDCDGLIDAADASTCELAERDCENGLDDDGDGLVDGNDPDCSAVIDGDGDHFSLGQDCDDTDPTVNPDAPENCDNLQDDDCDGEIDLADVDCNNGRE